MLDPVSLGAITTGLIVKAVDRSEDDALDAGPGALRRLLGFLAKPLLPRRGRAGEHGTGPRAGPPDSPSRRRELAAVIDALAQDDEEFRSELDRLIGEARQAAVEVGMVTQTAIGDQMP